MSEVSAGLRRGDLLNTAPYKQALMNARLIGFSGKTKARGRREGGPRGASIFLVRKWSRLVKNVLRTLYFGFRKLRGRFRDMSTVWFRYGDALIRPPRFGHVSTK